MFRVDRINEKNILSDIGIPAAWQSSIPGVAYDEPVCFKEGVNAPQCIAADLEFPGKLRLRREFFTELSFQDPHLQFSVKTLFF